MKKVMISQPMRGKEEAVIRQEREALVAKLKELGYEVIDTIFPDFPSNPEGRIPVKYLAKSIDFIADVDVVCFMEGWEKARGCIIEHSVCQSYLIPIMYATKNEIILREAKEV